MDSEIKGSPESLVRHLVRLPIIDRVKAVKDLMLRELGGIHSDVASVHANVASVHADVASVHANVASVHADVASVHANVASVHADVASVHADVASVHATAHALLANDSPLLQSSIDLVQAVQHARLEVDRQGQLLLNSVGQARQERRRQIEGLLEVLKEIQAGLDKDRQMRRDAILLKGRESAGEPEVDLMAHLYSYLPSRTAVDIGANVGDISDRLLEAGYEVYAFEPNSGVFDHLSDRLGRHVDFHSFPWALGPIDETRQLYTATDVSGSSAHRDASLYSSLTLHSMPDGLVFSDSVSVTVRSLESLHASSHVPVSAGLVKIDTEGFDLEVIRGMGPHRYPVVVAEYWDPAIPFAMSGAMNRLDDLVKEMKGRGYHWYVVFYRIWGKDGVSFYCNHPRSIEHTYGNVFFFQDHTVFAQALLWCSAVLPATYVGR